MKTAPATRRLLLLVALLALPLIGAAQEYPSKPIRIVVPVPAGGAADTLARIVGARLQAKWGQTVIIDNRAGAGGNIGAALVADSTPDGYTLLITPPGPLTINKSLYKHLPYDPEKFEMISIIAANPNVLLVNPSVPVQTLPQLVAYAKANPGKINFASGGIGSTPHLAGELLKLKTGIDMSHVPYKGGPPAYTDLLGGHIQVMFQGLATALPNIQDGRVRVLAIGSPTRSSLLPGVPTLAETIPGFVTVSWTGFAAPAGTPLAILAKIQAALAEALKGLGEPGKDIKGLDARDVIVDTPAEATRFVKEERERWGAVVRASGATAD